MGQPPIKYLLTSNYMITVTLKENAWQAKLAAKKLGHTSAAIVFGRTIYLTCVERADFMSNRPWVRHEITHVKQYVEYGFLKFIMLYLVESMRKGYMNNRFEVEARKMENDDQILSGVAIV